MKKVGLACLLGILLVALSCGHPTAMVSMSVTPATAGIVGLGAVLPYQYTAYGNFIHPTETRDISNQVTWTSNTPWVATVNSSGVVTPTGGACGGTIITATAGKALVGGGNTDSQSVMTATATFTVYAVATPGCPAPPS
jgi:hypothetical protein